LQHRFAVRVLLDHRIEKATADALPAMRREHDNAEIAQFAPFLRVARRHEQCDRLALLLGECEVGALVVAALSHERAPVRQRGRFEVAIGLPRLGEEGHGVLRIGLQVGNHS